MARLELTRDTATPAIRKALTQMSDGSSPQMGLIGRGVQLMLDDIGEYLMRSTRERARQEKDPEGNPWVPLSPKYAKYKQQKRPGVTKLKFDFHMLGDQFTRQVIDDELLVGTNAIYGRVHQFGGRSTITDPEMGTTGETIVIPARPWLGLSKEDRSEILAIARDHLAGLFD